MSDPKPLAALLREPFDDAQVERMWRAVETRRAPRRALWPVALPLTAACAMALALIARRPPPPPRDPGPLRIAGAPAQARGELRGELSLSDASRISLSPNATLTVRANDGGAFDLALGDGRARFDVTPGGPRRWRIDCGLATVTVVGTSFTLDRAPHELRVSVSHGRVWVDGPLVPGLHRALAAGESIALRDGAADPVVATEAPAPQPVERVTARAPRPAREPTPAWRARADAGDARGAWEALGDEGFARASRDDAPETLLALADVARRTRRHALAAPLLARVVEAHPTHPEAAMAAFTLGRDALTQRGDAAQAARWFERALALRPPRALEEDLRARLAEARGAAGDRAGACAAARSYATAFPSGARAGTLRRWCE